VDFSVTRLSFLYRSDKGYKDKLKSRWVACSWFTFKYPFKRPGKANSWCCDDFNHLWNHTVLCHNRGLSAVCVCLVETHWVVSHVTFETEAPKILWRARCGPTKSTEEGRCVATNSHATIGGTAVFFVVRFEATISWRKNGCFLWGPAPGYITRGNYSQSSLQRY
jgi:hypothetical protein